MKKTIRLNPTHAVNFLQKKVVTTFTALLCLLLLFSNAASAQDPAQYGTPYAGVPDVRDVNMYQVHVRPYSAAGNLAGVTARLDAIKALGTNVIYLMPIYPTGTDSRSSISPYCIKDFKAVGSEYGSLTDLRTLVDGAHSRGMAVMLDWVVNQTSWDHPWITQHPDWYVQSGGVIQPLNPFPDVAALNFNSTAMRAAMVDAMRYWIFAANIDGYRCDYANNPPLDFWTNTINNLRGITSHKLLMFAEGDRLTNFTTGFDMNFGDKWYYDAIKPIASGGSVAQIQTTTNTEYTNANSVQQVARYTANHDTESENTPFSVFQNHNGVVVNFLVSGYMRGVPFLTSGQEVDFNQTIPWPYTSVKINWTANPGAAADFTKVLNFRNNSTAVRRGTMANYSDANVCGFTKINGSEKVVVIANMRNGASSFVIPAAMAGSYTDPFNSNASVTLTAGATQALTAFQYRVLTNANVPVVAVTGVSISPASVSVSAGLTTQLTATVAPANATNQNVSWASSNNAIATVNSSGSVTGVAAGSATITATTQDGNKTATRSVTVTAASSFTVHFFKPAAWGTGIKIYYWNFTPAGAMATVNWPGVNMTSEGNGYYQFTFTNVTSTSLIFNDGTSQTADLTRSGTGWYLNGAWYNTNPGAPVAVTGVTVSPSSATVAVGATQQLTATVAPANAANKLVSWSSSNNGVATVSATGLVTAVAGGTATITVTTQDGNKTATAAITVPAGPATWYNIQNRWQPTQYLYDGGNGQVKYGTAPSGNQLYQWTQVDAGGGYKLLKNRSSGKYMHVENQNGAVQCGAVDVSFYSAMWTIAAATDGWSYIQNRWQTSEWIHNENQVGYVQYSNVQSGWYSAMWKFVNPVAARGVIDNAPVATPDKVDVSIYPNPVQGKQFFVQLPTTAQTELTVVRIQDMNGRIIVIKNITGSAPIKHELQAGMYFVRIISKGIDVTRKLVVL